MTAKKKIHIIGLGVAEKVQFDTAILSVLPDIDVMIGASRQLDTVAHYLDEYTHIESVELPKLSALKTYIASLGNKTIAILASGDPLYYGIGQWLLKNIERERLVFHPAVSSIQAVCHALGLSLQVVNVVSLHGRPLASIRTQFCQSNTLLVLTDKHSQPAALARECQLAGYESSIITVCEKMGYSDQRISTFSIDELVDRQNNFDSLHISVIQLKGNGGVFPVFPGIEDHHYQTGHEPGSGMISKREVRLMIQSMMAIRSDEVVWDIGAGCGGVAVEMALWQNQASIYAVEQREDRLEYLKANREYFGATTNLDIVSGEATGMMDRLPNPHKVFIGGSGGRLNDILEKVWHVLPLQGFFVVSAVTEKTREAVLSFIAEKNIRNPEVVELSVSRGELLSSTENKGLELAMTPKKPITLFKCIK